MKKSFLIPTLTAAAIVVNFVAPNNNALAMQTIGGTRWWTVPELQEIVAEMEGIADEACGTDASCRKTKYVELIKDKRYSTANKFSGVQLVLSRANPSESTITWLYQGTNQLKYRKSVDEKYQLEKIYVGWIESDSWETVGNNYSSLLEHFQSGEEKDGMHFIYKADKSLGDEVVGIDEKITVRVEDEWERMGGRVYYIALNEIGNGVWGSYALDTYLEQGGYEYGMDCEMMYSENSAFGLWPVISEEGPEEEFVEEPEVEGGAETEAKMDWSEVEDETDIRIEDETEMGAGAPDSNLDLIVETTIKTPETGKGNVVGAATVESPWWMNFVVFGGLMVVFSYFSPRKNKKMKKIGKKSKKVLDKRFL